MNAKIIDFCIKLSWLVACKKAVVIVCKELKYKAGIKIIIIPKLFDIWSLERKYKANGNIQTKTIDEIFRINFDLSINVL